MCVCGLVVVPLLSVTLSRMPKQLYDLPFDMLEMIGEFYDDLAQGNTTSSAGAHITTSRNTNGGRANRDELSDHDVLVAGSERLHGAYTIRMYRAPAPVCTVHSAPVVSVVLCIRLERVQSDSGTPAVILRLSLIHI